MMPCPETWLGYDDHVDHDHECILRDGHTDDHECICGETLPLDNEDE